MKLIPRRGWRRAIMLIALSMAAVATALWIRWSPGLDVRDGSHDRGMNGMWMQHGWLASDEWLARNGGPSRAAMFRDPAKIAALAELLRAEHVTDVFPHAGPADDDGLLPPVDDAQVERFLDAMGSGTRVLPWIGANRNRTGHIESTAWRSRFTTSAADLLARHPRFSGVHVNIEPCRSGDPSYLALLQELRAALPPGSLISVSAYPPLSWMRPFPDVQWHAEYAREVAARCDQLAFMMYDTGLRSTKMYRHLMATWTRAELGAGCGKPMLLGVPTYDDTGVAYHDPSVENLHEALLGIHEGLAGFGALPADYQGLAIYCEWEMSADEWRTWEEGFRARPLSPIPSP